MGVWAGGGVGGGQSSQLVDSGFFAKWVIPRCATAKWRRLLNRQSACRIWANSTSPGLCAPVCLSYKFNRRNSFLLPNPDISCFFSILPTSLVPRSPNKHYPEISPTAVLLTTLPMPPNNPSTFNRYVRLPRNPHRARFYLHPT